MINNRATSDDRAVSAVDEAKVWSQARCHMDASCRRCAYHVSQFFAAFLTAQVIVALLASAFSDLSRGPHHGVAAWSTAPALALMAAVAAMAILRPTAALTRHAVAVGQAAGVMVAHAVYGGDPSDSRMLFYFAMLPAFYRDWRVVANCAASMALLRLSGEDVPHGVFVVAFLSLYATTKVNEEVMRLCLRVARLEALNGSLQESAESLFMQNEATLASSRAKSQYMANISHEFRTPLNAVVGYSELIAEQVEERLGDDAADVHQDIRRMQVAANHMMSMINDVIDIARFESGRIDVSVEEFDVAPLVDDVVSVVKEAMDRNGNSLSVSVDGSASRMCSDPARLRQSLCNILSNAAKFTKDGSVALDVRASGPEGARLVTFRVSDTGIGMTDEQMSRLFKPFSQAKPDTRKRFGGTGLGLAITRNFCQLMGGDVEVESAVDVGTTFTITLPQVAASKACDVG